MLAYPTVASHHLIDSQSPSWMCLQIVC
jgi:hypothetical protein